jgi:homocysteine S-methyltransferase
MAEAVAQKQTRLKNRVSIKESPSREISLPPTVSTDQKSDLAKKMVRGKSVILVEMVSPRGRDVSKQIQGARQFKKIGIEAINIPDGPRASSRMNGLAMAVLLQNQVGIESVLHYTCRDRNLLGIQSDLLGASVLGIKNILAITGDPPVMGDYPDATAVFDIDSIGLVRLLSNLNRGLDVGNKLIGEPTGFFIGVGVDPNSINLNREIKRFQLKIEAGAEFAITQPVFDIDALILFLEKVNHLHIPIIAGIWPLISLRNAEFMKNEVPGVSVPDSVIDRIGKYQSKEDQLKIGIEMAQEMAAKVHRITQGIQISTPFGRYDVAMGVAEAVPHP